MTYTAKPLRCDPTKLRGYQVDYGASAERYVDAFMENIDWAHVARLHQAHASREPESEFEVWGAGR
jgi:hypothetical protein